MKKGDVYRHYKGGIYTYFGIAVPKAENHKHADLTVGGLPAKYEETEETLFLIRARFTRAYITDVDVPCVVYKDTKDGQLWLRPVDSFFGYMLEDGEPGLKRFKLVESK